MVAISVVTMVYKRSGNWGGHHLVWDYFSSCGTIPSRRTNDTWSFNHGDESMSGVNCRGFLATRFTVPKGVNSSSKKGYVLH